MARTASDPEKSSDEASETSASTTVKLACDVNSSGAFFTFR